MDFNKELNELSNRLKYNDWFYDISLDKHGRIVVYALWMDSDVMSEVPSTLCDKQVLLHFADEKIGRDYKWEINSYNNVENKDPDLSILTNKLDKLEKVCGTNILGDIFFESHDLDNAVTNWSVKYPDIRKEMDKLLDQFGFDVIYEELEL